MFAAFQTAGIGWRATLIVSGLGGIVLTFVPAAAWCAVDHLVGLLAIQLVLILTMRHDGLPWAESPGRRTSPGVRKSRARPDFQQQ